MTRPAAPLSTLGDDACAAPPMTRGRSGSLLLLRAGTFTRYSMPVFIGAPPPPAAQAPPPERGRTLESEVLTLSGGGGPEGRRGPFPPTGRGLGRTDRGPLRLLRRHLPLKGEDSGVRSPPPLRGRWPEGPEGALSTCWTRSRASRPESSPSQGEVARRAGGGPPRHGAPQSSHSANRSRSASSAPPTGGIVGSSPVPLATTRSRCSCSPA